MRLAMTRKASHRRHMHSYIFAASRNLTAKTIQCDFAKHAVRDEVAFKAHAVLHDNEDVGFKKISRQSPG